MSYEQTDVIPEGFDYFDEEREFPAEGRSEEVEDYDE
jgi:hypothetical protein